MFGLGIVKGLGVTLKHFFETYIDDLKYFPKSMVNEDAFAHRQGPDGGRGLFTVEYPEMKLKTPENFRFIPFLVTDYEVSEDSPDFDKAEWLEMNRCTSCGICAKVCPPQCIWIVRTNDPKTGKPIPQPAEFYIDTDVCMNCGYCAEFCPFDAIKMDHTFELADYEREDGHIHDLERLLKPTSYYASIRPTWNAQEEATRKAAEEEKQRKEEEKQRKMADKAAAKKAKEAEAAQAEAAEGDQPRPAAKPKRSPEEIKAQREAMLAKKKAKEAQTAGTAEVEVPEVDAGATPAKPKRTPEEIKAQREAMLAKRMAREEQAAAASAAAKPAAAATGAVAAAELTDEQLPAAAAKKVESKPTAAAANPETASAKVEPVEEEAKAKILPSTSVAEPAKPDDLTKIEGIGPKISGLLQAAGIKTFADLALTEVSKLEQILTDAGPRYQLADPISWPDQAKLAAVGKWKELEALQDKLKGGRHN